MADYTRLTDLEVSGVVKAGALAGALTAAVISKAADYALADDEKQAAYIGVTLTAASKKVTLGLPDGAVVLVVNEGSNAFTLKNVSGDTGTSIASGKAYLVRASTTANGSKLTLLNDGT